MKRKHWSSRVSIGVLGPLYLFRIKRNSHISWNLQMGYRAGNRQTIRLIFFFSHCVLRCGAGLSRARTVCGLLWTWTVERRLLGQTESREAH